MVIIVQKLNGKGGNIYINPDVSNIDATLIADGALMNGVKSVATILSKDWISHGVPPFGERLIINGRLLTHNTR